MDSSDLFSHPEQAETQHSPTSQERVQAPVFSDHTRHDASSDTRAP